MGVGLHPRANTHEPLPRSADGGSLQQGAPHVVGSLGGAGGADGAEAVRAESARPRAAPTRRAGAFARPPLQHPTSLLSSPTCPGGLTLGRPASALLKTRAGLSAR